MMDEVSYLHPFAGTTVLLLLFLAATKLAAWFEQSIWRLMGALFAAELGIMLFLMQPQHLHPLVESFIDAAWISLFMLPFLIRLKSNKRTLQTQLHRTRVMLTSIGDAVIVTNHSGRVEFMNPHAETLTGWTLPEAEDKRLGDIFRVTHEQSPSSDIPDIETLASLKHDSLVPDVVLESRNGHRYYIEYSATSVDHNDGEIDMVLVFRDISERHRILREQEETLERLNTLIEALPDSVFFKDGTGRWLTVNRAGQTQFQLDGLDWQGKTDAEISAMQPGFSAIHEACRQSDDKAWAKGGASISLETLHDANGEAHHFDVTKVPLFSPSGARRALVIIGRDITQKIRADEELNLLASVFRSNRLEGIMITTAGDDPRIIRVNQAFTDITGYAEEEVKGRNPRILKSGNQPPEFYREMWQSLLQKGIWGGEIWNRRKEGDVYPQWLSISAVAGPDQVATHYIATQTDLSQRKEHEARIHQLAFYDALTGLPNRTLLEDRMQMAIANAERSEQVMALLFIDLDDFKTVNDGLGHAMGDELLKMAAMRLSTCVREGDTLARLGGDEFVVLLPGFPEAGYASAAAAKVAEKISDVLSQPFWLQDHEIVVTPSIGITMYPADAANMHDLLKQADTAMYAAKAAGRNTFRFFAPSMNEAARRRMTVESHLRHALERNEMKLHYQPQVLKNGKIVGAEALLRWHNQELGHVSPMEFIPLAEETGSIIAIGEWVIRSVCQQIKVWSEQGVFQNIEYIAVNISARQFRQPEFVDRLHTIVQEAGIVTSNLELEITESSLMHNIEEVKTRLQALKSLGFRMSVDDFGTGYSSLAYLKHFPIDVLKIDRSFVRDIGVDADYEAISRTIINLADNLGLKTIAEGVENQLQLTFLDFHGCQVYQGFFFGKPMSAEQLSELIVSGQGIQ